MGGLASSLTAGPSGHTISPHPSSREGHHATIRWELTVSPIGFDLASSCCCSLLPAPAELAAVNPDAMHDHSQPARQCHDCLLHAAAPGDLHRPGLEPGPSCRFVEHHPVWPKNLNCRKHDELSIPCVAPSGGVGYDLLRQSIAHRLAWRTMDWARILAFVTGMVDQELLARNEYLAAENRIQPRL